MRSKNNILQPVNRYEYENTLINGKYFYEVFPWMGLVVKAKINDIDIPVKIVIKSEDGKPHKYLDVKKYQKLYNKDDENILKIWTDLPI